MTAWGPANDAELISAVRGDDDAAWAELCHRHLGAARRFARTLVPAKAADELVERAAEQALADLRRGEGPDVAFRPYLLAAVRSEQRSLRTVAGEDRPAVRAYRTLPERWQLVLWHVGVERDQPGQVAPLIGVAESAVQGMTGRARAGLRAETLALYDFEADDLGPDCERVREQLPAHLHGATARRESGRVEAHLQTCADCREVCDELAAIDDDLAGVLAPVVLGAADTAYLAPRRAGVVARHPGRAALVGVAAAVALVTGLTVGLNGGADAPPVADAPPITAPPTQEPSSETGGVVEPSPPTSSDPSVPESTPAGLPTASSEATTATSGSPVPPPVSPSSDSTLDAPDTSGPSSPPPTDPPTAEPPPTTPPPTQPPMPPPPPKPVDPAVTATVPTLRGPVAVIVVDIDDVDETDGRLTVKPADPRIALSAGQGCAQVTRTGSLVCALAPGASTVEIVADLSKVTGLTAVEVAVTPKPEVVETQDQRRNNRKDVYLQAPASQRG